MSVVETTDDISCLHNPWTTLKHRWVGELKVDQECSSCGQPIYRYSTALYWVVVSGDREFMYGYTCLNCT